MRIHPVILSGGSGTRLWPLSRSQHPKQLLSLSGEGTMLQQTLLRVADPDRFAPPVVVANNDHRFIVAEQLRETGVAPRAIVLEPVGRNTAPAAAVAALLLADAAPDAVLAILPSDHLVRDGAAFDAAMDVAAAAASSGRLVTFGIAPGRPETGYGYIRQGAALAGLPGAFAVDAFVEKPDRARAESYLADGRYAWNSGMFVVPAAAFLAELERLHPRMLEDCRLALAGAAADLDFLRLAAEPLGRAPALSIDYAVMEHTVRAAVVPVDFGWSDVGAWNALWEIADKDAAGNAV
ncbi:MAG: mannose-1-phosphate guanylyltransferase/mannose-6-phosphate isomerase, partial [Alphaproteobacteria bacterium]